MRVLTTAFLAILLAALAGCGSGGSSTPPGGALSGNWQFTLTQNYPQPSGTLLSVSGFLSQSGNALTGMVQGPAASSGNRACGGVGPFTGSLNGQSINFSVNPGGGVFNFAGTISSDNTSMTGTYQALAGGCVNVPTTGTFIANLIPPLNASFTGTLDSNYVGILTSGNNSTVNVSGSFTQAPNAGASNAGLTGTMTAVDYPCFTTVSLTGTISGGNVYLDIYNYNGQQIGQIGSVSVNGNLPAIVAVNSGVVSLTGPSGPGVQGFSLINPGPCPSILSGNQTTTTDFGSITLTLQ